MVNSRSRYGNRTPKRSTDSGCSRAAGNVPGHRGPRGGGSWRNVPASRRPHSPADILGLPLQPFIRMGRCRGALDEPCLRLTGPDCPHIHPASLLSGKVLSVDRVGPQLVLGRWLCDSRDASSGRRLVQLCSVHVGPGYVGRTLDVRIARPGIVCVYHSPDFSRASERRRLRPAGSFDGTYGLARRCVGSNRCRSTRSRRRRSARCSIGDRLGVNATSLHSMAPQWGRRRRSNIDHRPKFTTDFSSNRGLRIIRFHPWPRPSSKWMTSASKGCTARGQPDGTEGARTADVVSGAKKKAHRLPCVPGVR